MDVRFDGPDLSHATPVCTVDQTVHDLVLALTAPLGANDYEIGHFLAFSE